MTAPTPYDLLPATAREALRYYRENFGGELTLHAHGDFGRVYGRADAVAHGVLKGTVTLYAADVAGE